MCMYEESTRTPLAIKLPQGEAQVESVNDLVSHVDMLPTLCDLVGVEIPNQVSGHSLADCIRSGHTFERDHVFVQFDGNGALGNFQRCIVQGDYKLIVDTFKDEIFFELYNVVNDPQELTNLAFDSRPVVTSLYKQLLGHMQATNDHLVLTEADYDHFLTTYTPLR